MKYSCPECQAVLNPTEGIVLLGYYGASRGLFVFDARPGHYEYRVDPSLAIEPGSAWEFLCPVCHTNLTSQTSTKLAHLRVTDEDRHYMLLFSKVADEHATVLVSKEKIETYGEDYDTHLEENLQKDLW
jgi:hypothetical protein